MAVYPHMLALHESVQTESAAITAVTMPQRGTCLQYSRSQMQWPGGTHRSCSRLPCAGSPTCRVTQKLLPEDRLEFT